MSRSTRARRRDRRLGSLRRACSAEHPPTRASLLVVWLALLFFSGGCYFLQSARDPLQTTAFTAPDAPRTKDLMVVLPGILDGPEDFASRGFVGYVRSRRRAGALPFDVLGVNAHLGYYKNRSILDRLRSEIIAPARAAGYERIHLLGVSLGGFGSLLYLRKHPEDIASVTLVAPYLGEDDSYSTAAAVGFSTASLPPENLWPWLTRLQPASLAKLRLGYGSDDGFAELQGSLATLLPRGHVVEVSGGHDWITWSELWPTLLERVAASRTETGSELLATLP